MYVRMSGLGFDWTGLVDVGKDLAQTAVDNATKKTPQAPKQPSAATNLGLGEVSTPVLVAGGIGGLALLVSLMR